MNITYMLHVVRVAVARGDLSILHRHQPHSPVQQPTGIPILRVFHSIILHSSTSYIHIR
jgi:hypothetical protein